MPTLLNRVALTLLAACVCAVVLSPLGQAAGSVRIVPHSITLVGCPTGQKIAEGHVLRFHGTLTPAHVLPTEHAYVHLGDYAIYFPIRPRADGSYTLTVKIPTLPDQSTRISPSPTYIFAYYQPKSRHVVPAQFATSKECSFYVTF